jgi:hypothetical protein
MSPTYRWFGADAVKSRLTRSGTFWCEGSGTVVRTFLRRCTPTIPNTRITRSTRLWLTLRPVSRSSAITRGDPYVPSWVAWICRISSASASSAASRAALASRASRHR